MFTKHSLFVVNDNDDDLTHNSRPVVHTVQIKISNSPEVCELTYTHTCAHTLSTDY